MYDSIFPAISAKKFTLNFSPFVHYYGRVGGGKIVIIGEMMGKKGRAHVFVSKNRFWPMPSSPFRPGLSAFAMHTLT
jgi:hypothetical protein